MKRDLKLIAEAYEEVGEVKPKLLVPDLTGKWKKWLNKLSHDVNDDGSVNIYYQVRLDSITFIPFKFKYTGDFSIYFSSLRSLQGSPEYVNGNFTCSYNPNLTSLEGGPITVNGYVNINDNSGLTSLKGGPTKVSGSFEVVKNWSLTSLEGSPESIGFSMLVVNNPNLTSLEGCPKYVSGAFVVRDCPKLKSLKGLPPGCTSYKIEGFTQEQIDDYFTGLELKDTATGDPTFDDFFGIGED